jgi:hypothetical protein
VNPVLVADSIPYCDDTYQKHSRLGELSPCFGAHLYISPVLVFHFVSWSIFQGKVGK